MANNDRNVRMRRHQMENRKRSCVVYCDCAMRKQIFAFFIQESLRIMRKAWLLK